MKVKVVRYIDAAPETVFARIADPTRWPWGGRVEHVAGRGAGATFQITDRIGPHVVESRMTLTAAEPPRRIAWRTQHDAYDHAAEVRLEAVRRRTRIVAVDEDTWHHAPWWTRWSARRAMRRDLQRRLAAIEAAVKE